MFWLPKSCDEREAKESDGLAASTMTDPDSESRVAPLVPKRVTVNGISFASKFCSPVLGKRILHSEPLSAAEHESKIWDEPSFTCEGSTAAESPVISAS